MTRERFVRFAVPIAVTAFVVALTLLLLYNPPLRRVLLDPIVWMANDIRNGLAKLPQALLWAVALLIGCAILLVAWRKLLRGDRGAPKQQRLTPPVRPHNANAVAALARDLRRARRHHVSRVRVVRELTVLAIRMIAKREGIPLDEARTKIRSGQWPDDPEIRRFFALRRDGAEAIRKHGFDDAVEATLAFLDRYHQEV